MIISVAGKQRCLKVITWAAAAALVLSVRGEHTLAAPQGRSTTAGQNSPNFVEGRVLVKFQPQATAETVRSRIAEIEATDEGEIPHVGIKVLKLPPGRAADAVARAMKSRPGVEFAEVDAFVAPDNIPNDPYYSSQWHLAKIQGPTAWDTTTGSSSLIIAILDTGVDGTHPDLAGDMVPGWNFYDNNSNTADVYGHGTAVAGTAAAMGNDALGVASVAWNSRIMPIRISDTSGITTYSTVASALTWAADHGARVANISYIMYPSATVLAAAQYFQSKNGGGVVTISSGNGGTPTTASATPYALVVGSTDSNDNLSSFSTTGSMIDLVPPGEYIYTTTSGGGYGAWSGTSFSAPIVAGVAALVLSVQPGLTGPQVQNILEKSADDLGSAGWDSSYGYGRVNAAAAVSMALGSTPAPAPPPPPTPPADTTAPTISFMSLGNGSTISGTATVQVSASDNVGVAAVSLSVDGSGAGTDTASPYTFGLNTSNLINGSHTLTATAKDAAGNAATTSITVSVNNTVATPPPAVTANPAVNITSPSNGATLSKGATISARATDTVAITRTELYIDSRLVTTSSSSSISMHWNLQKVATGTHVISAMAYDASGATASTSITVNTR